MNSVDPSELDKFSKLKQEWWDVEAKLKTLHDINEARISFIVEHVNLQDKTVLDVGCGGGILTEALAQKGVKSITGVDLERNAINVAKEHAKENKLDIEYQFCGIENIDSSQMYDVITCLEMLEHVPEPEVIIHHLCKHLKPNGSNAR